MSFAYPGTGRQLYRATYASGQPSQVTYPLNATIATSGLSDSEPISDAFKTQFTLQYATAPGATTTIQYCDEPTFTNPITLTTIPSSADKTAVVTITEQYPGFLRISNTSTAIINRITVQKQVATNV